MADLRIGVDISGYLDQVEQARNKDIPFATALALTRTAQDAQTEVRRVVGERFTLRNTWTTQNIKIDRAEKKAWPITAAVYTDTGNDSAPDYLVLQDEGGAKQHHGSPFNFAIPTKFLRKYAPSTIPAPMRAKSLLPVDAKLGVPVAGRFEIPATGKMSKFGARVGARRLKTLGSVRYVAFLQVDHRGTLCIFVRVDGNRDAEPWYVLTPRATVKAAMAMLPTVESVVDNRFEQHWDDAWAGIRQKG